MSIVEEDGEVPFEVPPPDYVELTQPNVVPPSYRSKLVDSRYEPFTGLLTHVEGSIWVCNYYSQVLGEDDQVQPYNPTQDPIYQNYIKIHNMELRVSEGLSNEVDTETNQYRVTGSAYVYPFIKINTGDIFVADIGGGRLGLFVVTSSTSNSLFKQRLHQITYTFHSYLDNDDGETDRRLVAKTTKNVYFRRDFLKLGQYPLLVEKELVDVEKLEHHQKELVNIFMNEFFSREFSTFLVPVPDYKVYDPFATKIMTGIVDRTKHPLFKNVIRLNVDGGSGKDGQNLWTMLSQMDKSLMPILDDKMWMLNVKAFNQWPTLAGVAYSGLYGVVYPEQRNPLNDNREPSCDGGSDLYPDDPMGLNDMIPINFLTGFGVIDDEDEEIDPNDLTPPPLIHHVQFDDYYVLSQRFYKRLPHGQSQLELITHTALDGDRFEPSILLNIIADIHNWRPLDRYYYIPLLIILCRVCIRRMT